MDKERRTLAVDWEFSTPERRTVRVHGKPWRVDFDTGCIQGVFHVTSAGNTPGEEYERRWDVSLPRWLGHERGSADDIGSRLESLRKELGVTDEQALLEVLNKAACRRLEEVCCREKDLPLGESKDGTPVVCVSMVDGNEDACLSFLREVAHEMR